MCRECEKSDKWLDASTACSEKLEQLWRSHHSAVIGIVEPLQQLHAGALATAAAAHEGQRLTRLYRHVEPVQDLDVGPGGVGELAVNEVEVPLEVILKTQNGTRPQGQSGLACAACCVRILSE